MTDRITPERLAEIGSTVPDNDYDAVLVVAELQEAMVAELEHSRKLEEQINPFCTYCSGSHDAKACPDLAKGDHWPEPA